MTKRQTLAEFVSHHRSVGKKPGADILSRWKTRVFARGLHKMGSAGATSYLRDYGRGISAAKVIALATVAEDEGHQAVAAGFWSAAYSLATSEVATPGEIALLAGETPTSTTAVTAPTARARPGAKPHVAALGQNLQPGSLVTMQPVDATHDREHYCLNPEYVGQPKRDGNRLVVIASGEAAYYQSRSLALRACPDPAFDAACLEVASGHGAFVLDGELVFLSASGSEHRTGAQAAQANAEMGRPEAEVLCVFSVFKALFAFGRDLTGVGELERISVGESVVGLLRPVLARHAGWAPTFQVEMVPTAWGETQKRALCETQRTCGREGEIWIRTDAAYVGGKHGEDIVRTKYLTETEVVVTGLTATTVAGRPFGAIEVAETLPDGSLRPVGCVGSGFSVADARDLAARVASGKESVRISVIHQGWTENRQLWHARFVGMAA